MTEPIAALAAWLADHVEWMRHRPEADEFLRDVEGCARVVRSLARGPAEQKYLGPCGAAEQIDVSTLDRGPDAQFMDGPPCEGDVYASRGSRTGRCRVCGAEVSTAERAAWLEEQTADLAAPARDIAYALGVNVKTIRTWATEIVADNGTVIREAKLKTYRRLGEHVVPWTVPTDGEARGPRLHYVGDVRQLARDTAVRRAEDEARRARRRERTALDDDGRISA